MRTQSWRFLAIGAVVALGLTGCSSAASSNGDEKVSITMWTFFKDRELAAMQKQVDAYEALHPLVTVKLVGGMDDDKITQAIRGGNGPDIAESPSSDNLGKFCSSGSFVDLDSFVEKDSIDLKAVIPETVLNYTSYKGQRCAMPSLADAYALYYNKDLFSKAGISSPPKTMSELAAAATKLTQYDADGSIKVAGFVPVPGFYEENVQTLAPPFAAQWQDGTGKSSLASSAGWSTMLQWQRDLAVKLGPDELVKFISGAGQEFSADNSFETGNLAMMIDGEWRTAFIEADKSTVSYATAPFPVSDDTPELYGTSYTTGCTLGITKDSKNQSAAWGLIKYLSLDANVQGKLADDIHAIPSTVPSLKVTKLAEDEYFKTFIDIFGDGKLKTTPLSPDGSAFVKTAQDFAYKYVTGGTSNLQDGLKTVDTQIDASSALG